MEKQKITTKITTRKEECGQCRNCGSGLNANSRCSFCLGEGEWLDPKEQFIISQINVT
jgi:recombinational DNA repair protein RecR